MPTSKKATTTRYLLLGEGDFTYSLDMCRYLASFAGRRHHRDAAVLASGGRSHSSSDSNSTENVTTNLSADGPMKVKKSDDSVNETETQSDNSNEEIIYSITCTGVDTLSELTDKYKDVDFILRNIRQCSSTPSATKPVTISNFEESIDAANNSHHEKIGGRTIRLITDIIHGVNAVEAKTTEICQELQSTLASKNNGETNDSSQGKAQKNEMIMFPPNQQYQEVQRQQQSQQHQQQKTQHPQKQLQNDQLLQHYDHVLFHHPHLGTEDAQLHSRFLNHFFYAAVHRWLKKPGKHSEEDNDNHCNDASSDGQTEGKSNNKGPAAQTKCLDQETNEKGGLLYLTLVTGQCERWKCIEGATKQGLVLLRRGPFVPPPPPLPLPTVTQIAVGSSSSSSITKSTCAVDCNATKSRTEEIERGNQQTFYQPRRHQSGKSFANRRRPTTSSDYKGDYSESETLVFGRACDYPSARPSLIFPSSSPCESSREETLGLLPWEQRQFVLGVLGSNGKATFSSNGESKQVKAQVDPTASGAQSMSSKANEHGNLIISDKTNKNINPHQCKYCPKSFGEERSLKNHIVCSHPDCEEARLWKEEKKNKKKSKNKKKVKSSSDDDGEENMVYKRPKIDDDQLRHHNEQRTPEREHTTGGESAENANDDIQGPPWICNMCETQRQFDLSKQSATATGTSSSNNDSSASTSTQLRIFPHKQALLDHQRAKHLGDNLDIKPDWYREAKMEDGNYQRESFGSCPICDLKYESNAMQLLHEAEFVPSPSVVASIVPALSQIAEEDVLRHQNSTASYNCAYCSKSFRELRAQQQHENFCSWRERI